MPIRPTILAAALATALLSAGSAGAAIVELSTFSGETLGGVPYRNGDVVRYDTVADVAALVFDEDLFGGPEDVDAWEVLPNGNVLLSTLGSATLGGLLFENGSVVQWDGSAATLIFNENVFLDPISADIDAVAVHPSNGNLLFSTRVAATIGALSFGDGDIVMWDGSTASIFFAESSFGGGDINVDAFDVDADGTTFLLSTENDVTLGGTLYLNGDLILFDSTNGTASLAFPESRFGGPADIDAAAFAFDPLPVPEPGTASLLGLGLTGLALAGRGRIRRS